MQKILLGILIIFGMFFSHNIPLHADSSDISSDQFTIDVKQFTPGGKNLDGGGGSSSTINGVLGKVINSLIVAFWVISLLFMTVWAWYMIVYHGQDELLSRWKSMFTMGLISLAIALSAGMIVKFIAYLLYQ